MASAYPVPGYRTPAARGSGPARGFQPAPTPSRAPANDNVRTPANDNVPGRSASGFRSASRRAGLALAGRLAARAVPLLGLALLLWDLWELYEEWQQLQEDQPLGSVDLPPDWVELCNHSVGWNKGTSRAMSCGNVFIPIDPEDFKHTGIKWVPSLGRYEIRNYRHPAPGLVAPNDARFSYRARSPFYGTRPVPDPDSAWISPPKNPVYMPTEVPNAPPWLDPNSSPIGVPVPVPMPPPYRVIPHRRPNPWRAPSERPQRGPAPAPRRSVNTNPRTVERPIWNPEPGPSASPRPRPRFQRPRRGEKERKMVAAIHQRSLLGLLINGVTEGLDALYAVWDALPDRCKEGWRKPPPQIAAAQIYSCFEHLDLNQAAWNLLEEQFEDAVIGTLGQAQGRANAGLPFSFGVGVGPAL